MERVNDKEGCLFFSAWEGTGPVNLALWRVTMTRGFTGHKPRGMRECRKWATVSIFCQTALRLLLPLHSLCVYACNCYPLLQFKFPIEVMLLVSEALSSSLTFMLACISRRWFWPAQIETPPQRLTALFLEIVWNCRIKRRSRRQYLETHSRLHYLVRHYEGNRAEWQLHYDCCWHIGSQLSTLAYSLFNCLI